MVNFLIPVHMAVQFPIIEKLYIAPIITHGFNPKI